MALQGAGWLHWRMHYLRHSWFDPTSLSSRNVVWDVLSGNHDENTITQQAYRSALLAENDAAVQPVLKRRGRQRAVDAPIALQRYPEALSDAIGVWGNESTIHALYAVRAGVPAALVGIRVDKDASTIQAQLEALYVLPGYRRRGLGTAIAQHAGEWALLGMRAWSDNGQSLRMHAASQNSVEASLALEFFRSGMETAQLHGVTVPIIDWGVIDDAEDVPS